MSGRLAPIGSREAWEFEQYAGCSLLDALQQLRAGVLAVRPATVALLIVARRDDPTVDVDDILDSHPSFAQLIAAGSAALAALTDDPGEG